MSSIYKIVMSLVFVFILGCSGGGGTSEGGGNSNVTSIKVVTCNGIDYDVLSAVRTHPIWPPRAFILGQLTHQHLASLRIDYLASQASVMRGSA